VHTILRIRKVTEKTGLAKSTIYKKIVHKEFPRAISLGPKAVGWLESDIQKWIEQQIERTANNNIESKGGNNGFKETKVS
jgi:prophage regulatory protein